MAPQKGQKPNDRQKDFNRNLPGAKPSSIRAARQIASSRQFVYSPGERYVVQCVSCLGPRERREGPVCPKCTTRRKHGAR